MGLLFKKPSSTYAGILKLCAGSRAPRAQCPQPAPSAALDRASAARRGSAEEWPLPPVTL